MSQPDWLITEPETFTDFDLGPLKAGKEAEVFLVERVADASDRTCLLAHKRYRPRSVKTKGELQALGFQRSSSFVNDHGYRSHRRFTKAKDQRAADLKTDVGRAMLAAVWHAEEYAALRRLAGAGVHVPYPVEQTADGILMQFIGDRHGAAPPLARARLSAAELRRAASQLADDLRRMVRAHLVHADLSPYNILWWEGQTWIIDVPQAVDLAANVNAFDFLMRDLRNIGGWLTNHGVAFDADAVFADLMAEI